MREKANPLWRRAAALHFFTLHLPPLGLPFSDFPGGNQRPRRGRSAGVTFVRAKVTKTRLGRSPLRTSLWVRGCPCVLLVSALGPVGSHRWHGNSTERACFSGTLYFDCQGLTLVCNCSQLPEVWLPAAGTPLLQSRPGGGNHQVIGPVAMVAWCGGRGRGHSKGDGPNLGLTHGQPRTPGWSLGGNALSGFSSILATQNGPPAGSVFLDNFILQL